MDASAIFATIQKGLSIVTALIAAEKKVEPAIKVIYDLATNAQTGDVTDKQLAESEATLDAMIDDFNEPLA